LRSSGDSFPGIVIGCDGWDIGKAGAGDVVVQLLFYLTPPRIPRVLADPASAYKYFKNEFNIPKRVNACHLPIALQVIDQQPQTAPQTRLARVYLRTIKKEEPML
jgi:hypothetical protein